MTILQGLHVIEISGTGAAAMAAKHFADWGARVTILEPSGGTALREEPPYYEQNGDRTSATWAWLSRGKTAVRVGSGRQVTIEDARRVCAAADVVLVESEMCEAVLGLTPAQLRPEFDGTTTCVLISPFAPDGPYANYAAGDLGINAIGGWMDLLGDGDREPLRPGAGITPRLTGLFALVAALIGLRHVRGGGPPQFIDLSSQAVASSLIVAPWLVKSIIGYQHKRRGNNWPMGVMECADGFVGIPPLTPGHWDLLCHFLGIGDVLELPNGRDILYRIEHEAELRERVKPWLMQRTRGEIVEQGQAFRLPAAPVQTIADRLDCPQLAARNFWSNAEIDGKTVRVPRVTYSVGGLKPVERGPLREVDGVDIPAAPTKASGAAPPSAADPAAPPFAGLRVLDLTTLWSGPYAMMLLGGLGADVVKVESIQRPDPYRFTWAPVGQDRWIERAPLWQDANCNKRDITLDLTSETGRELLERLVAESDIVISNFANRVMPNLKLTNERLLEINPNVIAVSMPGYGMGGPWEGYVGYAIAFEQLICGSMTGYADGVPSYGGGFCDPFVGMHVVTAIELALQQRETTGKGLEIEIPQCETLDSLFAPEQIAVQHGAPVPSRRGNKHEWMAPHDAYRVAGEDSWVTIAVASDEEFASLATTLGQPAWASDSRFATVRARKENEPALDAAIAEAVASKDAKELERALQDAGVMACRVVEPWSLPEDAGLKHIAFFQRLEREVIGTHDYKTWPFRFSSIDTSHKRQPPLLGEHNAEVLGALGLSADDIAKLERDQVIGSEPLGLGG